MDGDTTTIDFRAMLLGQLAAAFDRIDHLALEIILIAIEILLSLYEMFVRGH